jgi:hypothetical protein
MDPTGPTHTDKEIQKSKRLRRNPLLRQAYNSYYKIMFAVMIPLYPLLTRDLDPGLYRYVLDWRRRIGMLDCSIISNRLFAPNDENTSIQECRSVAGRWSAYDHLRRKEMGLPDLNNRVVNGRLFAYPLEEILENASDHYSPLGLIDPINMEDEFLRHYPTIDELLGWGFIQETTYALAYSGMKLNQNLMRDMVLLGIQDKEVYQVTPKGNGLVFIAPDEGEPKKKPEYHVKRVLNPAGNI